MNSWYNNLHRAFSSFEVLSLAFMVTAKFHRVMAIVCSCSDMVPVCVFVLDDSIGGNSSISSSTLLDSWEQLGSPQSLPSCAVRATMRNSCYWCCSAVYCHNYYTNKLYVHTYARYTCILCIIIDMPQIHIHAHAHTHTYTHTHRHTHTHYSLYNAIRS